MAQASRDENRVTTLLGVSSIDADTPIAVKTDATTQRLFVDTLIDDLVETRTQTPTVATALNVQIGPGDVISNIPVVMDYEHHQVHEGETYQYHLYGAVNTTSRDIRISIPVLTATTRTPHFIFETISTNDALLYLYEGTTWTSGGTETSLIYNQNRNSTNTPATKLYVNGATALTVNALGTELWQGLLIATALARNNSERTQSEWDLKGNTEYLFRVTTTGNANVLTRLHWYEDLGV